MNKNFYGWSALKETLNSKNTVPLFKEREIWWCSLGVNVGHEQDGKNEEYSRPVLVVKKFSSRLFWGVPLTTKIKDTPHYHKFVFKGREQSAMLSQMRLWDANRMTGKMGRVGEMQFKEIKLDLLSYLQ